MKSLRQIFEESRSKVRAARIAADEAHQAFVTAHEASETARKELVKKCPHEKMLYGIYNQCADCEEWF